MFSCSVFIKVGFRSLHVMHRRVLKTRYTIFALTYYKQATNEREKTNEKVIRVLLFTVCAYYILIDLNREFVKTVLQLIKEEQTN